MKNLQNDNSNSTNSKIPRRKFIALAGSTALVSLAGCTGSDDNGDDDDEANDDDTAEAEMSGEENGDDDDTDADADDDSEDDDEDELTEEDVEQRAAGDDILEFEDLEIIEYEESVDEREYGDDRLLISGIVENHSDDAYDSITVEVRVYDADGNQLDRHIDITQNVQGGGTWAFEVTAISADAGDIDDWDIGVSGRQR